MKFKEKEWGFALMISNVTSNKHFLLIMLVINYLFLGIIRLVSMSEQNYNLGTIELLSGKISILSLPLISVAELLVVAIVAVAILIIYDKASELIRKVLFFGLIISATFICVFGLVRIKGNYSKEKQIAATSDILAESGKVIIGGGGIGNGTDYYNDTNSYEALLNAHESGNNVIELDFYETADGTLVCSRPNEEYPDYLYGMPVLCETVTEAEFLNNRVNGILTPLSLTGVTDFLRSNPEVYIVADFQTDAKMASSVLKEQCPDLLNRFIVLMTDMDDYEYVTDQGINNVIYNLDSPDDGDLIPEKLKQTLKGKDVVGVLCWESLVEYMPGAVKALQDMNIPVAVRPVDEPEIVEKDLEKGIKCFFTNDNELNWN